MLGGSVQSPVRVSQVSPLNPRAQVHVKASTPFVHVPPFWHGMDSQRLGCNSHNRPVRPGLHTQEKLLIWSKHVAPFLHGLESQFVALHRFPVQDETLKKRFTLSIVKHVKNSPTTSPQRPITLSSRPNTDLHLLLFFVFVSKVNWASSYETNLSTKLLIS